MLLIPRRLDFGFSRALGAVPKLVVKSHDGDREGNEKNEPKKAVIELCSACSLSTRVPGEQYTAG